MFSLYGLPSSNNASKSGGLMSNNQFVTEEHLESVIVLSSEGGCIWKHV